MRFLFEFVVAVLVALDLCLVKIPVIENSFRVVLGIDRVESVVLIGMRTVLLVDGIGYGDRHRFLVAGYAHRVVVVALQAGQRERLVRVGQPVGGHHLHGHGRVDAHGEQTHYELFPVRGNSDRIGYGRCREVLLGVDRTGGRQYVGCRLRG